MQRTNIYLDERQLRALKHLAAEERKSVATLVRRSVDAYLARHPSADSGWNGTVADSPPPVQPIAADTPSEAISALIATDRDDDRETRRSPGRWPAMEDVASLCRRHHIRWLAVFGSILRDDFGPESDVDVLVEFEARKTPGLAFIDVQDDVSALFGGRPVDLGTRRSLNSRIRDRVLAEARVLYDAA